MKKQKILLKEGSYIEVPAIVIDSMRNHRSEIITTWEQMMQHFDNCPEDCFEIWCRLQTGSIPHEGLNELRLYVKHVGQLPPDWGSLFHHSVVCDLCKNE